MARTRRFNDKLVDVLIRWRWPVVLLYFATVIGFEFFEHPPFRQGFDMNAWLVVELFMYGLAFPIIGFFTLSYMGQLRSVQLSIGHYLRLRNDLGRELNDARNLEEVTDIILEFPHKIAPISAVMLRLYDPESKNFGTPKIWPDEGIDSPLPIPECASNLDCPAAKSPGQVVQCGCTEMRQTEFSSPYRCYCIVLRHQNQPVGILIFYLPAYSKLHDDQIAFLSDTAGKMTLAIERAQLQESIVIQSAATEAERKRIIRDLHDSLGQHLAAMRLKLEAIINSDTPTDIATLKNDLKQVDYLTNQAYEQVRSVLMTLDPVTVHLLTTSLRNHATVVGKRSKIKISFREEGHPRHLSDHAKREILYIFRELMANIENHAEAERVNVNLCWAEHDLILTVRDNGKGFNPGEATTGGHYGLKIVRERTEDINGNITIASTPGAGTEVSLVVPLPADDLS